MPKFHTLREVLKSVDLTDRQLANLLTAATGATIGESTVACYVRGLRAWPTRLISHLHVALTARRAGVTMARLVELCSMAADEIESVEKRGIE